MASCGDPCGDGKVSLTNQQTTCDYATVDTAKPEGCDPFQLNGQEICFFDGLVEDHLNTHGTDITYWHQDIENSTRDPIYDEPIDRAWLGPYRLKGYAEYIAAAPEAREEGTRVTWNGTLWLSRKGLEDIGAPAPLEGDVVKYWDNRFFAEHSTNGEHVPGSGYYFDVVNSDDDGHVFDSANFTGFKLTIARRTEFTPERRLAG
jgi:hypothetical protein